MKKATILLPVFLFQIISVVGQTQTYDKFDGNKSLHYGARTGMLDTVVANPASGDVNSDKKCAKYVRNKDQKFDNIKMNLYGKLGDVTPFATYEDNASKIKMRVYSGAPVGTLVEIQLGKHTGEGYPSSIHSQYQAYTTKQNAWEELEFKFAQVPKGSETSATQVDQVTLLFAPNSSTSDTYYFCDLTGPSSSATVKPVASGMPSKVIKIEKKK